MRLIHGSWFAIANYSKLSRGHELSQFQIDDSNYPSNPFFADLSTTVQIRFFHWITMRHAEERHCERVRKSKPATKLMCTFSDLPVKLFRFCFTPFITLAFSLFLSPTPLAPFPFSFFLSLSFNIVVGKTKVKSI